MRLERLAAFAVSLVLGALPVGAGPEPASVDPPSGRADRDTQVELAGRGFESDLRVALLDGGPVELGIFGLPFGGSGVFCSGGRVYHSFYNWSNKLGGFVTLDVTDPTAPHELGRFQLDGHIAGGVAVTGDLAIVPYNDFYTGFGGMHVVDASDPARPHRLDSVTQELTNPRGVATSGSLVFLADASGGLKIVDITDPTAALLIGTLGTSDLAWDVAVADDVAYVADGLAGLQLVDVSDPTAPRALSSLAMPGGNALGVALQDPYAYVADLNNGLLVVDVSDPASPELRARIRTADAATGVDVDGPYAYVADGVGGLQVLDVRDPTAPLWVGGQSPRGSSNYYWDVDVVGGKAFVADFINGMRIIDVTTPVAPAPLTTVPTADRALAVVWSGSTAYVAEGAAGIGVFDLSDPSAPRESGRIDTPGGARSLVVSGNLLFVADGPAGVWIYDLDRPAAPLGGYDSPGTALALALRGSTLYLADDAPGVQILDVSDPAAPRRRGGYRTRRPAKDVAVAGALLYVADSDDRSRGGLVILDGTDPTAPVRRGRIDTPGAATALALAPPYVYVADGHRGVRVLDVSDPAAPFSVAELPSEGKVTDVVLDGNLLHVAEGFHGLRVVDVGDPRGPVTVARYDTPDEALAIALAAELALIADEHGGTRIVRRNPRIRHTVASTGEVARFVVPAGFTPGPYDVSASNPDGRVGELPNAFRICRDRALEATLVPAFSPTGPLPQPPLPWRLEAGGDPGLLGETADLEAWLQLPPLPADLAREYRPDPSRTAIELHLVPDEDTGVVRLIGSDEAAVAALWATIRERGAIGVPRAGSGYRELGLAVGFRPGSARGRVAPVDVHVGPVRVRLTAPLVFRYDFDTVGLSAARAWGADANLTFELRASDDAGCAFLAVTRYSDAIDSICARFPDLSLASPVCDIPIVNLPGGAGGGDERRPHDARRPERSPRRR